ncbi:MAG: hypothetical protein WBI14_03830 [Anaerolineaceae bacterium]
MTDHPLRFFNLKTYPWVLLGLCMLSGAMVGLLASYTLRPIYEAKASITANMEIVRNGNITEMMVDSQMTIIGSQVYDVQVVEEVLLSEQAIGHNLTNEEFRENANFERQMLNTILKYRDHDPEIAQRIVNSWAHAFYNRLMDAYPYGLSVSEARDTLQQIMKCQTDLEAQETDYCVALNPETVVTLKEQANAIILEESPLSMGLTSALTISNLIPADIPDAPLRYSRGSLILAGTFLGMAIAILRIEVLPGRKQKYA